MMRALKHMKHRNFSRRSPVMRQALTRRPSLDSVRAADVNCPICNASAEHLMLESIPPHRTQSYALSLLGISCVRWMRDLKTVHCLNCGTKYFNAELLCWNSTRKARRFADFGRTSLPLPVLHPKRGQPSLRELLLENLSPRARAAAPAPNRRPQKLSARRR
jgi:hypothetical protein